MSWGNRMKSLGVVASARNWTDRSKRLIGVFCGAVARTLAILAAVALLTGLQGLVATPTLAQVSCPPVNGTGSAGNTRYTFDEDTGTCVAASTNPINGFKIIADGDDLELDQVRTNAVANGDFDSLGSYTAHSLLAVSISPTAGGLITGVKNVGAGNFGLEFDSNAVKVSQTYTLSFTKTGTPYTITVVGQFGDLAPSPNITSIVITGAVFLVHPVPLREHAYEQVRVDAIVSPEI